MRILSERYDGAVDKGVIIYGCRETLDVRAFHIRST